MVVLVFIFVMCKLTHCRLKEQAQAQNPISLPGLKSSVAPKLITKPPPVDPKTQPESSNVAQPPSVTTAIATPKASNSIAEIQKSFLAPRYFVFLIDSSITVTSCNLFSVMKRILLPQRMIDPKEPCHLFKRT